MSRNVNKIITDRIIKQIETAGELPWSRPWSSWSFKGKKAPAFNLRGTPYRGMNSVLLAWLPYSIPVYASFKQIQEAGGMIRKGEKCHTAVFFKILEKTDEATGEETKIPMLRYYNVWNVGQCDGLEDKIPELESAGGCGIPDAQKIVGGYLNGPKIAHKAGGKACYRPSIDEIEMPLKGQFHSEEHFFSTLFHELTHSTGHEGRLNRSTLMGHHKFGSKEYGFEECVAEIGASYLCGLAGIEKTTDNSVAYIQSWLKTIQEDFTLLQRASAKAQKAFDLITGSADENSLPGDAEALAA